MIIFRGAIDHTAQQYNLFHLASLSAMQFICRGTILVGKNEIAMWLNITILLLKIYGYFSLAAGEIKGELGRLSALKQ